MLRLSFIMLSAMLLSYPATADDIDAEIRKVQTERIDVLKQSVALLRARMSQGNVTLERVLEAELKRIEAELEYAADPASRIQLLQESRKLLTGLEEAAMQRLRASVGDQSVLLDARAARLKVDVQILQAKKKLQMES